MAPFIAVFYLHWRTRDEVLTFGFVENSKDNKKKLNERNVDDIIFVRLLIGMTAEGAPEWMWYPTPINNVVRMEHGDDAFEWIEPRVPEIALDIRMPEADVVEHLKVVCDSATSSDSDKGALWKLYTAALAKYLPEKRASRARPEEIIEKLAKKAKKEVKTQGEELLPRDMYCNHCGFKWPAFSVKDKAFKRMQKNCYHTPCKDTELAKALGTEVVELDSDSD